MQKQPNSPRPLSNSIRKRLHDACRTNEPQINGCILFSGSMLIACFMRINETPWFAYLFAGSIWPAIAFACNLLDPIPED